jgi:hypothetical protein
MGRTEYTPDSHAPSLSRCDRRVSIRFQLRWNHSTSGGCIEGSVVPTIFHACFSYNHLQTGEARTCERSGMRPRMHQDDAPQAASKKLRTSLSLSRNGVITFTQVHFNTVNLMILTSLKPSAVGGHLSGCMFEPSPAQQARRVHPVARRGSAQEVRLQARPGWTKSACRLSDHAGD